jgi:lysophospholipase L1-like esterase
VSARRDQPEPFVRGAIYPAAGDVAYPRANPTDTARLPADIWSAASVPAGVRLELVGDAQAIDVAYRTTTGNLGYRGDGAGITFSVWRGGRKICEQEATLGDGLIRLTLGSGKPETPAIIYLPEGMQPLVLSLTAVSGGIAPAPPRPVWLAYGDWTTQGWIASGPARGWAAIAARKAKLNLVNLGYAGAGRGEIVSAEHIAGLPADIITIAYGESCWTRVPHTAGMVREGLHAFLDVIRQAHPATPVVVASPVLRPDAEDMPNKLGATLADIRQAIEAVTRERIVAGDNSLSLVAGVGIIDASHLADGIHPGDEGHKRIAAAMTRALTTAMNTSSKAPGAGLPKQALNGMHSAPASLRHSDHSVPKGDRDDDRSDGPSVSHGSEGSVESVESVGSVESEGSVPTAPVVTGPETGASVAQGSEGQRREQPSGRAYKSRASRKPRASTSSIR